MKLPTRKAPHPTALIVDDNPAMLDAIAAALSHAFPEMVLLRAASGAAAMAAFAAHYPGLVILDVQLPDADGIELTRRIVAGAPLTRVVVISIHATPRVEEQARAAGAIAFIAKDQLFTTLTPLIRTLESRWWQ